MKQQKTTISKFIRFAGIGVQLGLTMYFASLVGNYLDNRFQMQKPWFTLLFIVIALVGFVYNLLRQLNKLNKE